MERAIVTNRLALTRLRGAYGASSIQGSGALDGERWATTPTNHPPVSWPAVYKCRTANLAGEAPSRIFGTAENHLAMTRPQDMKNLSSAEPVFSWCEAGANGPIVHACKFSRPWLFSFVPGSMMADDHVTDEATVRFRDVLKSDPHTAERAWLGSTGSRRPDHACGDIERALQTRGRDD